MISKIVSPAYLMMNYERIECAWVQHNKRGLVRIHAKVYSLTKHKFVIVRTKYIECALGDPWFRQFQERFNSYDAIDKVFYRAR